SMPLFRVYAEAAGFNNGQTSLVFAAYIVGMLPCYIFLGGLSDRVGRRPVVIVSVCSSFLATAIITWKPDVYALIFARFFQGVGVGLGMGAATAYISELLNPDPQAASKAAALATLFTAIGFGGGALATSIDLLSGFTNTPVTYTGLLIVTGIGILLLFYLPKLIPQGGQLIRLPYFPPGSLPINTAIGICWAATGIVVAIIPTQLSKFSLTAYAGICLTLVNWSGGFIQPFIRKYDSLKSVKMGLFLVPLGFMLVIAGCIKGWLFLILLGTSIVGLAAYGFSYLGGLDIINRLGGAHKARAVSGFMFFGYIGFGIPSVCLGYFADHFGITNALWLFEISIVVLSVWLYVRLSGKNRNNDALN
ncbi:MAG: MFS transporter, partial [Bacteroidota bacterium]|nr:MFS transporter [Bacteroidota bacterium]